MHIDHLLAEFEVHTVSYGASFKFPARFMAQARKNEDT